MSEESKSTRRSFLKGGAIVAAPLAVMAAPAAAALADDRLARLEDEKAIRELHALWLRHLASGDRAAAKALYANETCACALAGIGVIAAHHADALDIAADGCKASASYAATVEVETLIAPDNTLAQMLHAQGEGYVRASEARTLEADYVKTPGGSWAIAKLNFTQA
ncbi:MAG: hypothetical protein J7494_11380 [Sphingobium sp.]|nr:hypothetical protein [Sphingobium sp.]